MLRYGDLLLHLHTHTHTHVMVRYGDLLLHLHTHVMVRYGDLLWYAVEIFSGTLFAVSLSDVFFRASFPSFLFGVPFLSTLPSRKGICES